MKGQGVAYILQMQVVVGGIAKSTRNTHVKVVLSDSRVKRNSELVKVFKILFYGTVLNLCHSKLEHCWAHCLFG